MKLEANPKSAAVRLKQLCPLRPTLAIVLGSGFHHVPAELQVEKKIPCARIPGFPVPTVPGHAGEVYFGRLDGTPVLVLGGRVHFYEGRSMDRVTFAVRALAAFGIRDLLLTNAAGGINRSFRPGDFMVLADHINFMGTNPLRGGPVPGRPRFVDLTEVYDARLNTLLFRAGKSCKLKLRRGVYLAVSGPSYETPAEIRFLRTIGADVVGMSTVAEAIAARHMGIKTLAISCVTNMAAGILDKALTAEEVFETTARVQGEFTALLHAVIPRIDDEFKAERL